MQLRYDITDGGAILRRYISVNLGWWQILKNVVEKLWQRFAVSVFAPFFHSLYPATRFPAKSRGPQDGLIHILYLGGPNDFPKVATKVVTFVDSIQALPGW